MSDPIKVGVVCHTTIVILDEDNAPVTGLVSGDFTKTMTKDGAADATSITVTEINSGTHPGEYDVSFTPGSAAKWHWWVKYADDLGGWEDDFTATTDGVLTASDVLDAINGYADLADIPTIAGNVYELLTRLTSARAGYLDLISSNLDVAVSTRQEGGIPIAVSGIDGPTLDAIAIAVGAIDIDTKTLREALRYIAAATAGKSSGDPGGPVTFKGLDGTTDRVESTMDSDGNRTAVVLDP